jgi:signal transduction histidine kinase
MREPLAQLGGSLDFQWNGEGMVLRANLPLSESSRPAALGSPIRW